jgi:hypothetical protein
MEEILNIQEIQLGVESGVGVEVEVEVAVEVEVVKVAGEDCL